MALLPKLTVAALSLLPWGLLLVEHAQASEVVRRSVAALAAVAVLGPALAPRRFSRTHRLILCAGWLGWWGVHWGVPTWFYALGALQGQALH